MGFLHLATVSHGNYQEGRDTSEVTRMQLMQICQAVVPFYSAIYVPDKFSYYLLCTLPAASVHTYSVIRLHTAATTIRTEVNLL